MPVGGGKTRNGDHGLIWWPWPERAAAGEVTGGQRLSRVLIVIIAAENHNITTKSALQREAGAMRRSPESGVLIPGLRKIVGGIAMISEHESETDVSVRRGAPSTPPLLCAKGG